jgi:hypothetical protein
MRKLHTTRVAPGEYRVADRYFVSRTPDGWRWIDGENVSTGGEWRGSKRETMADLRAHVVEHFPTLQDLIDQGKDPRAMYRKGA